MKAQPTTVVLNNQWGYRYTPQTFPSKRKAMEHVRFMINNGYAWAYRIVIPERKE